MLLSRRQMLASAGAVAASGLAARPVGRAGIADARNWPLWSALSHRTDFVALGRRSVAGLPELQWLPVDRLHRELAQRLGVPPDRPVRDVALALRQGMAREFAEGDTGEVDGWYLSRIEILLGVVAFRTFAVPPDRL